MQGFDLKRALGTIPNKLPLCVYKGDACKDNTADNLTEFDTANSMLVRPIPHIFSSLEIAGGQEAVSSSLATRTKQKEVPNGASFCFTYRNARLGQARFCI